MERKTFSLFLRIFTLSSVFFTETLPPPGQKMQERKRLCSSFPIYQISRIRQCTIFSKSGQKILYLCQIFAVFRRLRFPDVYVTIKPRFDTAMYRERAEKDAAGFGFGRRSLRACRRTGGSAGRGAGDGAGAECKTRQKAAGHRQWPLQSGQHRHRARAVFHLGPGRAQASAGCRQHGRPAGLV